MTTQMTQTRPELRLQEGETVLLEGSPVERLYRASVIRQAMVLPFTVVGLPLLPLVPWMVRRTLEWHRWWLTDRRLVVRTGFIGWSLRSVPLDRIVDVTTRASWWDRLWNIEHIVVRDMTGEVAQSGVSTGLYLMGVEDSMTVAERILVETPRAANRDGDMTAVVRLLEQLVDRAA